jgi:probable HAF family extracellular repeat protein
MTETHRVESLACVDWATTCDGHNGTTAARKINGTVSPLVQPVNRRDDSVYGSGCRWNRKPARGADVVGRRSKRSSARGTGVLTALTIAACCLVQQACTDHRNPAAPPDTTHPISDNVVRACTGGTNAIKGHLPKTSPGLLLVQDTGTVMIGGSLRTYVTNNDHFVPPYPYGIVGVLPAMYGHSLLATTDGTQTGPAYAVDYAAPVSCTGTDSLWYIVENGAGVRDTGLLVVRIAHPAIGRPDSVDIVTNQAMTLSLLPTFYLPGPEWPNTRVVGFVGSLRGTARIASASTFTYVAPSTATGVDSVRVIFEATSGQAIFRDTVLARFNVLQRGSAPGPYSVVPIAAPGVTLSAKNLSTDGKVVGTATFGNGETRAFKWMAGVYTDLGLYNGARTVGVGINALGDAVGYAKKSDSTTVALLWKANGTVVELGPGQPQSMGITDGGIVVTNNGYYVDGAFIRQTPGFVSALDNLGDLLLMFPGSFYQTTAVTFRDGHELEIGFGHGSYPVLMNDSGDVWIYGSDGAGYSDAFYENVKEGAAVITKTLASVFPEMTPLGDTTGLGTQARLKLDNHRNLLETNLLVTGRGAFLIDSYIADHTWHLVQAISMNDRGQILGIGHNATSGVTTPIVLDPPGVSSAAAALSRRVPGQH